MVSSTTDGPDLRAGLIRTTTVARVTRDNEFEKDMVLVVVVLILAILAVVLFSLSSDLGSR